MQSQPLKNKYLQYGDLIYLYSNEDPKTYLSARSFLEKSVFFLQTPDAELLGIQAYPTQSELLFSIYPKLYYEASKNYLKFKGSDLRKKAMLKKRMDAEKEINQKRIERFLNDFVTIGSEIQLFHVFSKCYVKATREKNSKSNQLFNLALAKQLSSGMHFKIKINPYYSFKKDGEKISYEDQFYFENLKLESRLVYKDIPLNPSLGQRPIVEQAISSMQHNAANKSSMAKLKRQPNILLDEPKIESLFLMETQSVFKHFEAGHRKDDINNFKALFLSSPDQRDVPASTLKPIRSGDYVRVRHIRRSDKKQGNLYSEHIVTGECPRVFLYTQELNSHNIDEKDSATSIFQVMCPDEDLLGKPLEITTDKLSFPLYLRHFLTGRFLRISERSSLSEKLVEKTLKLVPSASQKLNLRPPRTIVNPINKEGGSPKLAFRHGSKLNSMMRLNTKEAVDNFGQIEEKVLSPEGNRDNLGTQMISEEMGHELRDFYDDCEILLTVASKDLGFLNSSHCFSLMGQNSEKFLSVMEEETVNEGKYTMMTEENPGFHDTTSNFLSPEVFQRTFFNMNPLDRKNFDIKHSEEADFFFFSPVLLDEISDIMTVQSSVGPLIALSTNFLFFNRTENVASAENSLEKLCLWVCESKEKRVEQIKTKPIKGRQKLMRELGVIDLIMKILFELFDRRLMVSTILKPGTEMFSFANSLISLLSLSNSCNYPNSIYIFQWYSLIKMIISDDSTAKELKFDDLLIQLFHETKLNVSYRGDLERLAQNISFTDLNRNVLNLVIAFCTYNEYLQKDDIEDIIATILENDENRCQIFRKFVVKVQEPDQNKRLVVKLDKLNELEINERSFLSKPKVFLYVSKLIVLAIELSKGNPSLVIPFFDELFPFEVCLEVLKAKRLNPSFKSLFVNLFVESYLTWDCRYAPIVNFPNNIKVRGRGVSHYLIDAKIKQNNLNLMIKYFNEKLESEGNNVMNRDFSQEVTFEDHELVDSILNLVQFVLFRGFYTTIPEAEDLRFSLQIFLRHSYAFLSILMEKRASDKRTVLLENSEELSHKKTAKINEEIIAVSHWMTKVVNCLVFLEKKNQDSFVSDFIAELRTSKFRDSREVHGKIHEFIYTLQYPDSMDIYYLIELLLLNNIEISQSVVGLLYLIFSMRRNFLVSMNQLLLIEDAEFPVYQSLLSVFYRLHFSIVEVNFCKSSDSQRNNELLCELDSGLKTLLGVLFVKEGGGNEGLIYNIAEDAGFDIRECFRKQNLIRESGIQKLVLEIIRFVNKNSTYKDKVLELKNEILRKCLIFLIFFTIKNEENKGDIREHERFEDLLIEILLRDNKSLQKLVFKLLAEIYRDNYPVLLNLDKMNNEIASKLGKKFSINYEAKKNKEFCIYFLLLLTVFFKLKSKVLNQNQVFLIKEFSRGFPDFPKTIDKCLAASKALALKSSELPEHGIREIPEDIVLSTVFFNVFSQIAEKSNNYVLSYCKQFFSVRELQDLLLKLGEWFMLKLELLSFVNQIYIKNKKLEENESSELQFFIKDGLLKELDDFLHSKAKSRTLTFRSSVPNIFEGKTSIPFSNEGLLIHCDFQNCYEHYIIFGVIETFANYLEKIPKKPNEFDILILEFYCSRIDELCKVLNIDPGSNVKKPESISELDKKKESTKNFLINKSKKLLSFEKSPESPLKKTVNFSMVLAEQNLPKNRESKKRDSFEVIEDIARLDLSQASPKRPSPQVTKGTLRYMASGLLAGFKSEYSKSGGSLLLLEEELERTHLAAEHLFQESVIEEENSLELDYLVEFLIEIKTQESKDVNKFKRIVENLINVVGSPLSSIKTKLDAIKIIRKLSNYKKDMRVNEEIQKELVDIELMNFLCKVTAEEENPLIRFEYVLGLIDFMDEVNENIQKSFFRYLENDAENKFIIKIRDFIAENFSDFKDYEKSLSENQGEMQFFGVSSKFNKIIRQKISGCIAGLELLRLGCENHYSDMQNFLRSQVQNNKPHPKSVNMIAFVADLLEKYSKMITERNKDLGEKILDFLIETLQGPCNENQLVLCNSTKILENLEDIMLDLQVQKSNEKIAGFTNKMIILMLALFEGNNDAFLLNKIVTYVTPELMYDRIHQIYRNFYKLAKKSAYKEIRGTGGLKGRNSNRSKKETRTFAKKLTNRSSQELIREESQEFSILKSKANLSNERIENSISEGFNIYIMMKLLSSVYPKLKAKISNWKQLKLLRESSDKETEALKKAIKYYRNNVVMIEIINDQNDIQRVFFRLPLCTRFLSSVSAKKFITTVNRESIDEKINGLLNHSANFLEEMQHFMFLRAKGLRIGIGALSLVRDIGLIISTVISVLILWKPVDDSSPDYQQILFFFCIMQLGIEIAVYVLWMIYTLPLDLKTARRNFDKMMKMQAKEKTSRFLRRATELSKTFMNPFVYYLILLHHMLFSSYFLYFTLNICWATLGITLSPIFNSLLLLDIIDRSVILTNVIKSITINWPQLVMTGILGLIVMFIYSMVGFYGSEYFRDNMIYTNQIGWDNSQTLYLCDSPIHCFMFVVNIGLRSGGGVGDSVKQPISDISEELYNERFFYDLSFFLIMNVILLNIIFGIIIDTFAELRVQKNMRDFDEKNNCFICGIDRSTFEKVGISFDKHSKKEHNHWNYLFYVIHLNLKDPTEFNGTESYVAGKLRLNDISWFPIGRALSLSLKSESSYLERGYNNKEKEKKSTIINNNT